MHTVKKWTSYSHSFFLFGALVACLMTSLLLAESALAVTKRGRDRDIGAIININLTVSEDSKTPSQEDAIPVMKQGFVNALGEAYGRSMMEVKTTGVVGGQYLKNPNDIFYIGAKNGLDHVIEVTGTLAMTDVDKNKNDTDFRYKFNGKVRIVDLATLKIVGDQPVEFHGKGSADHKPGDSSLLLGAFEQVGAGLVVELPPFYNPNIMEKLSTKKVADYFFDKEQCERASPIYEKAITDATYDFDVMDEMKRRVVHCQDVISKRSRLLAKYRLDLEFQGISETFEAYFRNAATKLRLADKMALYTDKPVSIKVSYAGEKAEGGGAPGEFLLTLVYDPLRFKVPERSRVSDTQGVIDLNLFNGPIAELVNYKNVGVQGMPVPRRELFSRFALRIKLENMNGETVSYLINTGNGNRILGPKSLDVHVKGFKPVMVEQQDESIRDKNQFLLGPAHTIDGKNTTSYVVYQFFGIKAK